MATTPIRPAIPPTQQNRTGRRSVAAVACALAASWIATGCAATGRQAGLAVEVPWAAAESIEDRPGWPAESDWAVAGVVALSLMDGASPDDSVATHDTRVRLLWNEAALFVRFECDDDEAFTPFVGRDEPHFRGDVVEAFVDPIGDGRQWYEFQATAAGDVFDKLFVMTGEPRVDGQGVLTDASRRHLWGVLAWDAEALAVEARSSRGDGVEPGWSVDMAIPAGLLMRRSGGGPLRPTTLHANFVRYDRPMRGDGGRAFVATSWARTQQGRPHVSPFARGRIVLIPRGPARMVTQTDWHAQ